jgi:hypothetical protein
METETKKQNWFRRHWIISIFLGIMVLGAIGSIFDSGNEKVIGDNSNNNVIKLGGSQSQNSTVSSTSLKYTSSDVQQMSLSKKLDICTKDIAGDSINIPQVKDEAYSSCYEMYYSGGEEVLNQYIEGIVK